MKILSPVLKLLILVFIISVGGCANYQAPEFNKIKELKVHNIERDFITLKGYAVFDNPNKLSFKVKNIDVAVNYKKEKVATINNIKVTTVPASEQFNIPFSAKIPTETFKKHLISDLMNIIGGKNVNLKFGGALVVSKFGINRKVPISYEKNIKIKL